MAAGSAAVAAPLVMTMAGKGAEVRAAEEQAYDKTYFINDNCLTCPPLPCKTGCPVGAIYFNGDKFAIDTKKCIRCGNCSKVCEIGAVTDLNAPPPVYKPHDVIQRDCDMLVIGGGSSGLIAATIAADLLGNSKKIIVLEKAKRPGGSGFYASHIVLFSTKWQRDAGVPDQMDDYIRSAMNITRWQLNPQLVSNSFHALPEFFDWFCTWGKPEELFEMEESRYSKKRKDIQVKDTELYHCRKIMHRIIDRVSELGVEILTEHAATDFIMNDKGEIVGVKAKDPGGATIINCKCCVVSTGNVANCDLLVARCIPEYAGVFRRRTGHRLPTNTGDAISMAERAGIPVDYDKVCAAFTGPNSTLAERELGNFDQRGEVLNINLDGKRWINESYLQWDVEAGHFPALLKQPKCMYYAIMDSAIAAMASLPIARIVTEGNTGGRLIEAGVPDPDEKEIDEHPAPKPDWTKRRAELERMASLPSKLVVIGETLEELADKLGVDRQSFLRTVNRYNALCEKGHDDDYLKPAKYLLPINQAPFYATSHYLGMDAIVGGLDVNEDMQVMGKHGAIENLYGTGDTISSRFINRGGGTRSEIINDMTWASASGFLAGKNIAKRLAKA
jgi:fumarate reductase flavoprotein subunit